MSNLNLWNVLKLMAIGAVSFWLPDTVCQAIRGRNFNRWDVGAITVLMPLTLFGTYILTKKLNKKEPHRPVGWPMMLGVWLLGGFFITVSASFSGGGFAGPDGLSGGIRLVLMSLLPIVTFMLATYDGSLGALFIVSLGAVIIWLFAMRRPSRAPR